MSLYDCLYPWQKSIVDDVDNARSYGLFLEMGLGKTVLGLALAERNKCNKVLVVTINSKAIEKEDVDGSFLWWAKKSSIEYQLFNKKSKPTFNDKPTIYVVNYEGLFSRAERGAIKDNIQDFIRSCKGENVAIILDESHKIKNPASMQTKVIFKIKQAFGYCAKNVFTYLMTGTPFTAGYIDIYSQLKMLGHTGTKTEFLNDFCIRGNIKGLLGYQQPIVGYKNIDDLFNLIHQYAITMKSDIVVDLPDKIFVDHTLPMSQDMAIFIQPKAKNKDIVSTFKRHGIKGGYQQYEQFPERKQNNPFYRDIGHLIEVGNGCEVGLSMPITDWLAETSGAFWLRSRQLSIGFQGNAEHCYWFDMRRLKQLETFLEQNESNYLLFYNYTPEMIEIYDICEKLGYNVDVYCGECKSLHFYEQYAKQSEAERLVNNKNIILANFASGSTGMNWQLYNQCIIFSVPVYKDYEQGLARIHRLGQKKTTIYHRFYQDNWLDKGMLKSLDEKQDYSTKMFDSDLERALSVLND